MNKTKHKERKDIELRTMIAIAADRWYYVSEGFKLFCICITQTILFRL